MESTLTGREDTTLDILVTRLSSACGLLTNKGYMISMSMWQASVNHDGEGAQTLCIFNKPPSLLRPRKIKLVSRNMVGQTRPGQLFLGHFPIFGLVLVSKILKNCPIYL